MKNCLFNGSGTALITPFHEDLQVDFHFFETLVRFQIENQTDALIIAGTTGESPVLTNDEKNELFEIAVSMTNKKIPVIAGTGSNNTQDAVRKSNEAEKKGVNGLLIVTPFYNKCTQEGLIKHYHYIADRVSTPIIVYNVPSRTGVNITPEAYAAITEHKNIVGIKEANGDLSSAAKTLTLCKDKAVIYSGNDDQTLAMMALGAKGVISVAANIIPEQMHKLTTYALKDEFNKALEVHQKYLRLMNLLFCEVNPIPVKAAAEHLFQKIQKLRLPLTEISQKNRLEILKELDRLALDTKSINLD